MPESGLKAGGKMEKFGGCEVVRTGKTEPVSMEFSSSPYHYCMQVLRAGQMLENCGLKSFTVFAYEVSEASSFTVNGRFVEVSRNQAFQVEHAEFKLRLEKGHAVFLLAGTRESYPGLEGISSRVCPEIKKVSKPWGHELWINGDSHPGYVLKQIFIRSGNRTSLQYHRKKEETIVLFSGKMRLHYKTGSCDNDSAGPQDVGYVDLEPLSALTNRPGVLHRMESLQDITVYEASTPHLDDVVRVSDDTGRGDGRIASEHGSR